MPSNQSRTDPGPAALALFLLLVVNSAYLAASASPSPFYFANMVLHVLIGTAAAGLGARWLRRQAGVGPVLAVAAAVLGVGILSGLGIVVVGATRPFRWLLWTHIATTTIGTLCLLAELARRARRLAGSSRTWLGAGVTLATLAVLAGAYLFATRPQRIREAYRIQNPTTVPLSMDGEGAGTTSPFFPSSANTNTGGIIPSNFFMTSEACGRCHKDIYEQWKSSVHHLSSFNNQWYRKSIEYMQDVVGTKPTKWCAGCHDHAVFFNGRFDRPIKEQIETPEAQAGLGCMSCHAITHVNSTMGQGDFVIEYPPLHDLAVSDQPLLRFAHDRLLYMDPEPHREAFLKPFHTEQAPDFCSSCHKVHLDKPVNQYRWLRGFNDYDNWQASGVSGEGARSFYYPPAPKKCPDCHMPLVASNDPAAKNGKVKSHRFPGANTALPTAYGDQVQLKAVQDFLQANQVSVDVFGLVRGGERTGEEKRTRTAAEPTLSSTFAVGEESMQFGAATAMIAPTAPVLAPLDKVDAVVRRGESVRVDVVVRTRGVGHFFPGGTVDAFDVWVEFEAADDRGRTIFHSGEVEDGGRGPVSTSAHFYRSLMLDAEGNPINKRNAFMTRSVAYVRLIPPGAADTVHYRLRIPEDAGERITLKARVNYRKFMWYNTQWAYAGERDPNDKDYRVGPGVDGGRWTFTAPTDKVSGPLKSIPDLPTTVMARGEAALRVVGRDAALPDAAPVVGPAVRERWNDYGIGLLLQGDLKAAEAAFLKVTEMEPGYADGWVNVARVRLQEGNAAGAVEMLNRALSAAPSLAKTHFFLGTALKALGRYDDALTHLRAAANQYPRDRVVRNQLGRVLFLKRQYRDAVAELQQVLAVDPEDLQAHYNLMLAYQGLGDSDAAARERTLYERFKADESAQAITGTYRQLHPDDNNERQSVHEPRDGGASQPSPTPLQTRASPRQHPASPGAATGGAR
jgi:tetratricopeptide (TPR) repeat protein